MYWLCLTRSVLLSDQHLGYQLQLFKLNHKQISKHFSLLLTDCLGRSYSQPRLYFQSHSWRQEWWPFTGLPEQKANTTLFLVGRRKTERGSRGRDPALCCWDNGKWSRARKHEEMHGCGFQTHARNVCFNPQTCWCRPYRGGYWWEFFVCVSLFNQEWSCAFVVSTVTNKKPAHVSLTKVKQFQGSSAFVKRSQWTLDQLRQVNGIDPNKVMPLPLFFSLWFWVDLSAAVLARVCPSLVFPSRTVQSSTWCLKMRLTSGALVQLEISAPSSRFSTTPASATARRGNQSSSTASPSWWGVRLSLRWNQHVFARVPRSERYVLAKPPVWCRGMFWSASNQLSVTMLHMQRFARTRHSGWLFE